MTKEEYKILTNSIEERKRDNGDEFYCLKDDTPANIREIIVEVMRANNNQNFDLDYKIMNSALYYLSEVEFEDLKDFDVYDQEVEFASVYTGERLSYLNNWNQDEITNHIVPGIDIATACAIWYDEQVVNIVQWLKKAILEDNNNE